MVEATIFAKVCSGLRLDAVVSHTLWMGKVRMEPPWWANDLRDGMLRSNDRKRMRDPGSGSQAVIDHRTSRDQRCR